jgi:type IV pilus assembly protein PilB
VRQKLGTCLVQAGLISEDDLARALAERARTGERLGAALIRLNLATEPQIARALGAQLGLPCIDLAEHPPEPAALRQIDRRQAEAFSLVPIRVADQVLTVAMSDPLQFGVLQELERDTKHRIRQVVATHSDILAAIQHGYNSAHDFAAPLQAEASLTGRIPVASAGPDIEGLLHRLAAEGATEIHLEPSPQALTVRHRVDGELHDAGVFEGDARDRAIARVKSASGLDVSEGRLAQEGRAVLPGAGGAARHFRVSTLRTVSGERVVMRLLDRHRQAPPIDTLGMSPSAVMLLRETLARDSGLILVAGPARSGLTTTLGAAAVELRSRALSVIAIESPVEYELAGVSHVESGAGVPAFAAAEATAAALRQRPDALIVGDVSDHDTAERVVEAAADCLVLASVRADRAADALTVFAALSGTARPLAQVLAGVVGQRLVRRLCGRCRRPSAGASETLRALSAGSDESSAAFEAVGCSQCHHTGYRGRVGIFEVMRPTGSLRRLIDADAPEEKRLDAAVAGGMVTLAEDGVDKVRRGITTLGELLRVMRDLDEVRTLCRTCGSPVGIEFTACPRCGTTLGRPCGYCGRFVQTGWDFCPFCARKMRAGP